MGVPQSTDTQAVALRIANVPVDVGRIYGQAGAAKAGAQEKGGSAVLTFAAAAASLPTAGTMSFRGVRGCLATGVERSPRPTRKQAEFSNECQSGATPVLRCACSSEYVGEFIEWTGP